jgi:hypothetical protein
MFQWVGYTSEKSAPTGGSFSTLDDLDVSAGALYDKENPLSFNTGTEIRGVSRIMTRAERGRSPGYTIG